MLNDRIILVFLIASCHWTTNISHALTSPLSSFSHFQSIKSSRDEFLLPQQRSFSLQPLSAVRRRNSGSGSGPGKKSGPGGAANNKSKKRSGPATNKKGNPKKTRKTTKTERRAEKDATPASPSPNSSSNSKQQQQQKMKKQSRQTPPWQVVSKKDMARNVQAEKQRRKLAIEEGIHHTDVAVDVDVDDDLASEEFELSQSFLSTEDKALVSWKRFKAQPRQDQVEFIGAYLNRDLPPTLGAPEVAFLGRSNVGKSSLLNRLTQSDQARVGKTPGATATVNLYGLYRGGGGGGGSPTGKKGGKGNAATSTKSNKAAKCLMGLVDLPGFGYAKLSKENKEAVQMAAERYLAERKELMLAILLVDIRRVPSADDKAVLAAMYDSGVPIIVVATKVDKLTSSTTLMNDDNSSSSSSSSSSSGPKPAELTKALLGIQQGLGLPEGQPLCISSVTGAGIKDLWRIIMEACEGGVEELRSKLLEQGSGDDEQDRYYGEDDAEFEDGEEVVYNQGYDWVHDSASVMYEDEYGDSGYVEYGNWDEEGGDDDAKKNFDDGDFDDYDDPGYDVMQEKRNGEGSLKSLKELRKQADEMERRGQL